MPRETSQNVVNALRLLECFAKEEELGITELSEAIGVGKTATSRLVSSLEGFGYLRQNPATKKYRLGMKLVYLGSLVQDRQEMVRMVEPYLRLLGREFQISAHLAVQERGGALILNKVSMGPMVYMDSRVGATLPLHASATGKCLLAFGGEKAFEAFIANGELSQYTDFTITDPARLMEEIRCVRESGYAMDNEESNIGLSCVGVPLLDARGGLVAALSLSGQTPFVLKKRENLLRRLKDVQEELARYL